jgi:hypothetical protein
MMMRSESERQQRLAAGRRRAMLLRRLTQTLSMAEDRAFFLALADSLDRYSDNLQAESAA